MSFPILGQRVRQSSSRGHRAAIGVEMMEEKVVLSSAAVTGAIYQVQQAQLDGHDAIYTELFTLKTNIISIQQATESFIYNTNSDIVSLKQDYLATPANKSADLKLIAKDKTNIKLAERDEKFAITQQNTQIKSLSALSKQVDSTAAAEIKGLNKGTINPTTVPASITSSTTTLTTAITTIDTTATDDLNKLVAVYNNGTP
jgi:hypothetical protein